MRVKITKIYELDVAEDISKLTLGRLIELIDSVEEQGNLISERKDLIKDENVRRNSK